MSEDALTTANAALRRAELAHQAITGHEKQCAERWGEARDEMRQMKGVLESFRSRFVGVLLTLVVGLLGLAGYLLVEGPPWMDDRPHAALSIPKDEGA